VIISVAFVPTSSTPLPVSVVIVARNEAAHLSRCLASVQGWVTEIVVLLNQTTDDSAGVAGRLGARVIETEWQGFRETKNLALTSATQPWALALDADEEVSSALRDEIVRYFSVEGAATRTVGADFPRKSWFLGRWITHGDWYPDRCLRLFRLDSGRWGGDPAHTRVQVQGPVAHFHSDLHHYSYPTLPAQVWKMSRQSDDFLRHQAELGRRWSLGQSLLRPGWRFVRAYVLRRGFLDGYPGFYVAASTAFGTLLRYSRLYEAEKMKEPPQNSTPHA
jgi:glycosyltransferase involved in cell wall biosynthesis